MPSVTYPKPVDFPLISCFLWKKLRFWALVSTAVFAFTALLGCGPETSLPPPSASPKTKVENPSETQTKPQLIILISIDTLRADHMSLYGYDRLTSPNLDLFAREGTVFADASSVAPWTLPAHASMLTGLYPLRHGLIEPARKLPQEIPTLAGLLAEGGWHTAAVVNSAWLLKKNHEITRDFDEFFFIQESFAQVLPTKFVADKAIRWIEEAKNSKLFIFMHYYDIHSDYTSMPQYENLFVSDYEGQVDGTTWQLNLASMPDSHIKSCHEDFDEDRCGFGGGEDLHVVDSSVNKIALNEADIQHMKELYDAGIRQLDAEIGRFLRFLEEDGRLDHAMVVITSDHGEEFSEHGRFYHFLTTYQEVLRVPVIFRGLGIAAGKDISAPISTVDLAPTILGWAGISPPSEMEGADLGALLASKSNPEATQTLEARLAHRFQYGEASGGLQWEKVAPGEFPVFHSVRQGAYKLIHQSGAESPRLYDLNSDPGEQIDISSQEVSITKTLQAELQKRLTEFDEVKQLENQIEIDPEEADHLRALGYIIE